MTCPGILDNSGSPNSLLPFSLPLQQLESCVQAEVSNIFVREILEALSVDALVAQAPLERLDADILCGFVRVVKSIFRLRAKTQTDRNCCALGSGVRAKSDRLRVGDPDDRRRPHVDVNVRVARTGHVVRRRLQTSGRRRGLEDIGEGACPSLRVRTRVTSSARTGRGETMRRCELTN